ncbi:hypothetical protein KVG96_14455 [Pseudomonas sp. COR58]|uniref:DUF599 domain-containing protein n=1 Tax=Pseudomonas ekonensis TaxID=2842353 RepID=A0ABS6PFA7_9PSED|nr:hypothetical protein [Pseudomonas ekonensis]MBV4459159.1 hypothetical protein [Pseudomonas ekonensis]
MNVVSTSTFALFSASALVALILLSVVWLPRSFFANTVSGGTKETAKEALGIMKDWAVWMAGIQTATIAALGLMTKDGIANRGLSTLQIDLAILVALFNTLALFFSAWLLTSLSSLMLRVYQDNLPNYDFYNFPLYAYMENSTSMRRFTVGFFAFWNHWLWGVGILLFGTLSVSFLVPTGGGCLISSSRANCAGAEAVCAQMQCDNKAETPSMMKEAKPSIGNR